MNDPDDTDPMQDETVVDTDPGPEPTEDTVSDERELAEEQDSDDFWQWLPTMGLAHRRRKELVERRSSDGADFAAYAGAARPAVAAPTMRFDAKVRIASGFPDGEAQGSRDALTVVKPGRGRRSPALAIGLAAVAAVSVTAAFAGWSQLPAGRHAHVASTGRAAPTSAPKEPSADRTLPTSSPGPTDPPMPTGAASATSAATTRVERPSPVGSGPPRQRERSAASRASEPATWRGPRPVASAPSLTKDKFFEAQ
ncbi:MAG: hypothetical protein ACRENE_18285 [Polyangiaceae bacterium]